MGKVIVLFSIFALLLVPGILLAEEKFDSWTLRTVNDAVQEVKNLKTPGDAEGWAKKWVIELQREFFFPEVGEVYILSTGIRIRNHNNEDLTLIEEQIKRMIGILEKVHKRLAVSNYETYKGELKKILLRIQQRNTPEWRDKKEGLERGIKFLENNQ